MVINMDETKLRTIAQLQEFLDATPEVSFTGTAVVADGDSQRYEHISRVLKRFEYRQCGKRERGVVLAYLRRTSGYSRTQITRLVARWDENRLATVPLAKRYRAPAIPFARKYTPADVGLLVEMDRTNEDVCGPAVVHLLRRAYTVYGDTRYERLAGLSLTLKYCTCTTCAKAPATKPGVPTSPRPAPCATPLACARRQGPMGARVGCASTACTKVTLMASRASITSPASMPQASGRYRPA